MTKKIEIRKTKKKDILGTERCKICRKVIYIGKDNFGLIMLLPLKGRDKDATLCSEKCWNKYLKDSLRSGK